MKKLILKQPLTKQIKLVKVSSQEIKAKRNPAYKLILPLTLLLVGIVSVGMAQSKKPRTAIIKKSITVDSLVYLPDTIPVIFKELIVSDVITEKWQRGFVVFQTNIPNNRLSSSFITYGGNLTVADYNKPYYTREMQYTELINDKFLYSDYTPVKNRVLSIVKP